MADSFPHVAGITVLGLAYRPEPRKDHMPSKDTSTIETRLRKADLERFKKLAKAEGKTNAQLLRDIALAYMDRQQRATESEQEMERLAKRDQAITKSLKSIENRFAGLIVKLGYDVESLYFLLWRTLAPEDEREKLFNKCYELGVKRWNTKLASEMKDRLKQQGDVLDVQ